MDEDEFFTTHPNVDMLFRAVFGGGYHSSFRHRSPTLSPIRRCSYLPDGWRKGEVDLPPYERFPEKVENYYDEADKNARELIKEEEEARLRAEKKRAKKKRQKQKKKDVNHINHDDNIGASSFNLKNHISENKTSDNLENIVPNQENKDTEGLDFSAAFMSKAIKKVKIAPVLPVKTKGKKEVRDVNTIVKKAQEFENENNFKEASRYYSEAIDLAPKRTDIILKRSHIYYLLNKFEKSIRDAQNALVYSPNNSKAYLRIGEGNFALKNLSEAEAAFSKLLSHNSYCDVAKERLFSIRVKQLEEMGYHPNEAFTAMFKSPNKTLDEAIQYLTDLENGKVTTEDLYYSDDDDEDEYEEEESDEESDEDNDDKEYENKAPVNETEIKRISIFDISSKSTLLTDHTNPLGISSLFVGNLKKGITHKEMEDVFIKYGSLISIKISEVEGRWYGFVNYVDAASAGEAMSSLQNSKSLLSTTQLLVKYPTNIVIETLATLKNPHAFFSHYTDLPLKKPTPVVSTKTMMLPAPPNKHEQKPTPFLSAKTVVLPAIPNKHDKTAPRPRPPPKTAECFYWRTFGCTYGDKCLNLHIPANKGIDFKGRMQSQKLQEENWD